MVEDIRQLWWLGLAVVAGVAWVSYAEHPTAEGLRTAVIDTLNLDL